MDKREILTALEEGHLAVIVDKTYATSDLNDIHNAVFHKALELGVPRTELIRRIDEINYEIARRSLLDYRDLKQMSRKTLEDYDPQLAVEVYKGQIAVMLKTIDETLEQRQAGVVRPEEKLFNREAYGQTLSTADLRGAPAVAVFTGLARVRGDRVILARIGHDRAYRNLNENPRAVFTAVGPSNDPSKYDFVTLTAELQEDLTQGEELQALRDEIGPAVSNCLVFSIVDVKVLHLPKPRLVAR